MKNFHIRTLLLLWGTTFFLSASPALASERTLGQKIEAFIQDSSFRHAHWGILVVNLKTGEPLFEKNPNKLFAPASTTKLYSVASAMDALGADYRFETPVYRKGKVTDDGRLEGDLILVASGDLSMGGRTDEEGHIAFTDSDHTYANGNSSAELTDADPLAGLNELARQVADSGIQRVEGELIIDDRLFQKARGTGSGPDRLTPIIINDNLIDFVITPTKVGQPASVTSRPETSAFRIDARIETVAEGEPLITWIRAFEGGRITLRGQIPVDHDPLVRIHEISDAASFARSLFIEALNRAGVVTEASPLKDNPRHLLPDDRDGYEDDSRVACLVSPPFAESARVILKVSHNLHAGTLPLLVAAHNGQRTLEDGLQIQHDFLKRIGVDVETISFGGGAGGARADYVTPQATVQLLQAMAQRDDFPLYKRALPVLGGDGTLANVVDEESPVRRKVHAKTGTLYWKNVMNDQYLLVSKALAGYLTDARGRELAFAAFINNAPIKSSSGTGKAGRALGRLCEIIHGPE